VRQCQDQISDAWHGRSRDTCCVEVPVDGLLFASTQVFSVERDCASRLFVVDVRWRTEGDCEERPLASDVEAMLRDGFLEVKPFRKVAKNAA